MKSRLAELKEAFERGCEHDKTLKARIHAAPSYGAIIDLLRPYENSAVSKTVSGKNPKQR